MGAAGKPGDLVQGTRDMPVLKTSPAVHGYGITEFIQCTSTDVLRVEADALYPPLH
jgi:hypothetical protein